MEIIIGVCVAFVVLFVLGKALAGVAPKDYLDTRGRSHCGQCKKISFHDAPTAQSAAENAVGRGTYLRAYYERRCGRWHLTSQQPRSRRF